jgi:hypothetical protein
MDLANSVLMGLVFKFMLQIVCQLIYIKKKGKAIPLQALSGPEGSRRLKLPDFKIIGT